MLCEAPQSCAATISAQLALRGLERSAEERFMRFHVDNPHVFEQLKKMALEWRRRGHQHGGIKMFWEALRYQRGLETADAADGFKLNNNYPARYARLLMQQVPELRGFFETRELHS